MICAYLDNLDGSPLFEPPAEDAGWESRRLEALARSLLDGLCVWGRELYRPADERSPTIIEHERQRSRRMADIWETEIDNPHLRGPLNMAQITLVCALQLERRNLQAGRRRVNASNRRRDAAMAGCRPLLAANVGGHEPVAQLSGPRHRSPGDAKSGSSWRHRSRGLFEGTGIDRDRGGQAPE